MNRSSRLLKNWDRHLAIVRVLGVSDRRLGGESHFSTRSFAALPGSGLPAAVPAARAGSDFGAGAFGWSIAGFKKLANDPCGMDRFDAAGGGGIAFCNRMPGKKMQIASLGRIVEIWR